MISLKRLLPRRILILKPSALGDIVHSLPVLDRLRHQWPGAHIAWLANGAFAGLLDGHPLLDEVIRFDRRRYGGAWKTASAASELLEFVAALRKRRFDLVIDLQGLLRSGLLCLATGARHRVGFAMAREFSPLCYTHRVRLRRKNMHAVDRYLAVCDALGLARRPVRFPFHVTLEDERHVGQLLGDTGPFALLMPGTNWATKRWPVEHFAALVQPLRQQRGLTAVLVGGADASELARGIPGALDLTSRTTLPQLVALIRRASLVIANDSGPMHIAAALNRPLVTMFGPTHPLRTGPYQRLASVARVELPCSPCYSRVCAHHSCMNELRPAQVLEKARGQLGHTVESDGNDQELVPADGVGGRAAGVPIS